MFFSQGELYVMGGSNGHSDELSCGEMYNPKIDEWIQVPELRTNRCNSGRHHFLLGNVLNIFYLFEWAFSVRSWRLKIKEPLSPVLVGTVKEWIIIIHFFFSGVCSLQNKLFVVGGSDPRGQKGLRNCDSFDPVTKMWTSCAPLNISMSIQFYVLKWL